MPTTFSPQPALTCLHLSAADVAHLHHTYGQEFTVSADGQVTTWSGYTFTVAVAARPDLSGRDHRLDACAAALLRFSPRGGRFVLLPVYLHLVDGNRRQHVAYTGDDRLITGQARVTPSARRAGVATTTEPPHAVRHHAQGRGSAPACATTTRRPNRPRPQNASAFDMRQQQQLMALREQLTTAGGGHR